jgi:hypothetical protein
MSTSENCPICPKEPPFLDPELEAKAVRWMDEERQREYLAHRIKKAQASAPKSFSFRVGRFKVTVTLRRF